jgi:predicted permease
MIERILGIFLPVLVVIVVGYAYALRVKPDMTQLNRLSMTILAPALVFSALASKDFDVGANLRLMAGCVGVVLGSGLLAWPVARLLKVACRKSCGSLLAAMAI